MLPLEDAVSRVLEACTPLPPVSRSLGSAGGHVLAADVLAATSVPPFTNSAMDGYAVRASDLGGASDTTPVTLTVIGEVVAGAVPGSPIGAGEACRIMTGAPIPDGADSVVMVERTSMLPDGRVAVSAQVGAGDNVRQEGDDVSKGDLVLSAGAFLGPAQLSAVASVGVAEVMVYPRPRVGVMSTGDELAPPGSPLGAGQVYESNRVALLCAVREAGFEPVDLGSVRDDEESIEAALREGALRCDAIVTSGGVSMGERDFVKVVLDRVGDMVWMQIAIKPAKPFAFGSLEFEGRTVRLLGLPGNPVASLVSWELLAAPALRQMAGHPSGSLHAAAVPMRLAEPIRRGPDGKVHFARVAIAWNSATGWTITPSGGQGSHQVVSMAGSQGLAVVPDGHGVSAGEVLDVIVLRWPGASRPPGADVTLGSSSDGC